MNYNDKFEVDKLLEDAPVGAIVIDNKNDIIYANRYFVTYFNCNKDIEENSSFLTFIYSKDLNNYLDKIDRIKNKTSSVDYINCSILTSENIIIPAKFTTQHLQNNTFLIYIRICNLTIESLIKKQENNKLEILLEQEKEKVELKSKFINIVSHDLRTPLNIISSSALLISKFKEVKDLQNIEKHAKRIITSINLVTELLNDLLTVRKIEENKIKVQYSLFDIKCNVHTAINQLNALLKNKQTISYKHEGDKTVHLDSIILQHININLLSNAIKFSNEGDKIEVYSVNKNNKLTLTFKDYGIGLSAEDKEHVFEIFYRGSNTVSIPGTGLGLHIVKNYIKLMDGDISFESELGKGSSVTITLPC